MVYLSEILLYGILIGVLVSAPMGPIGVLVIQRTLNKGRWPAFYTGMGAALSDMIYCLLTGLGLSFVTDFIQTNQTILQIMGSVILLTYAFYLFAHNPARTPRIDVPTNTYWKDFATGFLFTFANPLILFFIIGLFARFNFLDPATHTYHYMAGYLAIAVGALAWWFSVTLLVSKARGRFNVHTMWVINRVIALALAVMASIGLIMGLKDYFGV